VPSRAKPCAARPAARVQDGRAVLVAVGEHAEVDEPGRDEAGGLD
jgi:hypothetical protein